MSKDQSNKKEVVKEDFLSLLMENNVEKVNNYILKNGKMKPYCPIIFYDNKKDDDK